MKKKQNKEKFEKYGSRKITIDNDAPWDLGKIDVYEHTSLNSILENTSNVKAINIKQQFIDELAKHAKEGKDIYTYRAIKQALLEMKFQAKDLAGKVNMTVKEFTQKLSETMKTLDEHLADCKQEMYTIALELLSDDKGFEELEQAKLAYDKAMQTQYLMAAVEEKKALSSSKVDLLSVLHNTTGDK